ncbi:unnamed protein product [Eruca vesicaria subsp. sativa]|uniref:Uncharacterized protein n=1 Tax=Eruca vesicaria subsp. sativa TaxID=29727 RepID=A0ABC8J331_ERUVS|nr:unnamed protein product [Eruca vesicaria subsp. sativa]
MSEISCKDRQRFTGKLSVTNCRHLRCGAVPATLRARSDLVWFRGFFYVENLGTENYASIVHALPFVLPLRVVDYTKNKASFDLLLYRVLTPNPEEPSGY